MDTITLFRNQNQRFILDQRYCGQFIAFLQGDCGDTSLLLSLDVFIQSSLLYQTILSDEQDILSISITVDGIHHRRLFIHFHIDQGFDRSTLTYISSYWNIIYKQAIHLTLITENHQRINSIGSDNCVSNVILGLYTLTISLLGAETGGGDTLYQTAFSHDNNALFRLNELNFFFFLSGSDLSNGRTTGIAICGLQLIESSNHFGNGILDNRIQSCQLLDQFSFFIFNFNFLQLSQLRKFHIQNCFCLDFRESILVHKSCLSSRRRFTLLNKSNNVVNILQSLQQTFKNMNAGRNFISFKLSFSQQNILLVIDVNLQKLLDIQ